MPFDNQNHPNLDAIQTVERMEEILATPDKWCKHTLHSGEASCLYGSLERARTGARYSPNFFLVASSDPVHSAMVAELAARLVPGASVCVFNNDPETKHADILDFLASVKRRVAAAA